MCLSCLLYKPFMKREGENVAKRKWREGNRQKSQINQMWSRTEGEAKDFENKDKGKVKKGEPKGTKA